MSPRVLEATNTLRDFLFDRVYNVQAAQEEAARAREVLRLLYRYFSEHEDKLPPEYSLYSDEVERRVVDYIAGMTDQYASRLAEEISVPE
jgi:dGTPase